MSSTLLACIALLVAGASANIHLTVIGDTRRVVDLGVYAFSETGFISLKVHDFFIADPEAFLTNDGVIHHKEPIGFVLDSVESAQSARIEKNYAKGDGAEHRQCFINDDQVKPTLNRIHFPINGKKPSDISEVAFEATVTTPALYALFFYNCKGFNDTSSSYLRPIPVSFDAVAVMYNTDAAGVKHYLSMASRPLPMVYGLCALLFIALGVLWHRLMKGSPLNVHRVHYVMLFLVAVKSLSLLFEAGKLHHYDLTGTRSVWDLFYYVTLTVKGISLFSVLLLLGSGWSVMKQFLSEHDKKIMMIILPSQILVNISIAMIEENSEGSKHWSSWYDMLQILDVVCCCCVLLPIVWSIKNLRDAASHDDKAARTMARMKKFRTFYIVIVAYIYFTRIILVMIENSVSYDKTWLIKGGGEVAAALFYMYTGGCFRPMAENPYLEVDRDDAEELEVRKEVTGPQAL
ncbi:membrane-associated protein, putative [Bodo saltans]|uniref:Membrane-associated protein, putative n=1 Tax=Bodo saltans TaxID=75058 RepID=A0A0S4J2B2_BODSA|nr:membrane-associated protein, putative [Bodo saltans]|eukprot:CUG84573.1 membrane-associated protein, putative [Bodo saltans]